jgi:DNA-binding NarL/FixJ family response regulator
LVVAPLQNSRCRAAGVTAGPQRTDQAANSRRTGPARTREQAASIVRQEAAAGRLDGDVVEAVAAAASGTPSAASTRRATLTERELEVARLLAAGHSNKQIARRLEISENTARHHLESLYSTL